MIMCPLQVRLQTPFCRRINDAVQRVLSDGASAEHRDREERTPLLASLQPPIAASKSSTCLFGEGGEGGEVWAARAGGGRGRGRLQHSMRVPAITAAAPAINQLSAVTSPTPAIDTKGGVVRGVLTSQADG